MPTGSDKPRGKDRPAKEASGQVATGGWSEPNSRLRRKNFPGPADANNQPLRVAMNRDAYADLIGHAKESLNAEICGVLVGDLFEDDAGPFVSVDAVVRGDSAREGSTHVTFTQDTWTKIHEQIDQNHRGKRIVGWYHSHPGFGVEFSEMDLFIQRNFFSGPGQIAFVTDPLGGDEAILANADGQIVPVSRFWVDGRERKCHVPPSATDSEAEAATGGAASVAVEKAIKSMEDRINQLTQMLDGQVASTHRLLLAIAMAVAVVICLFIGYQIYSAYADRNRPPELQSFVPVPVQIGDKTVLLGVGIVKWDVPPGLNAAFLQLEREKQAAQEQAAKDAAATQPSTTQPTTAPSASPAKK